jgi:acetylornithine/N-succinyldiaminopimelate aminotransferase
MNLRQLDKEYFGRQGQPEDLIVGSSADSYLTDARGRKYIDFMMGWCVGNLGWGNTEIRAAAREFDGPDYVHPDHLYRPLPRFLSRPSRKSTCPGQSWSSKSIARS